MKRWNRWNRWNRTERKESLFLDTYEEAETQCKLVNNTLATNKSTVDLGEDEENYRGLPGNGSLVRETGTLALKLQNLTNENKS